MKQNLRAAKPVLSILAAAAAVWMQPAAAQVDPSRMVNAFEAAGGKFEGFRRSGAKGVCATGEFVGSAEGRALSVSSAFSGKPVPVTVRFSLGGGNPKAPDNAKSQRNMALEFDQEAQPRQSEGLCRRQP